MKIKKKFVLRQVADTWVVLPLGEATVDFKGMLTLNESGILLWRLLEKGTTREALAAALTEEYEVSETEALADADEFVQKLRVVGCLAE